MIYSSKAGEEGENRPSRHCLNKSIYKVKLNKVLPGASWYRVFFCDTITISIKLILWRCFENALERS